MAKANMGWIHTAGADHVQEFWTSNAVRRPIFGKKVQRLPPLNIHYDTPRSARRKQWTDPALLSYRCVNDFLSDSDAFHQASYANIMEKWKEHDKDQTTNLMSSFDSRYNMKIRFRRDERLNRTSEMKYGSGAEYHRFIGNESNPKYDKPCGRHKRLIQDYEERYRRELLRLPSKIKSRSTPYFLPKITKLPAIETAMDDTSTARSSMSLAEASRHTFA